MFVVTNLFSATVFVATHHHRAITVTLKPSGGLADDAGPCADVMALQLDHATLLSEETSSFFL
jgi:hypothetical protein